MRGYGPGNKPQHALLVKEHETFHLLYEALYAREQ